MTTTIKIEDFQTQENWSYFGQYEVDSPCCTAITTVQGLDKKLRPVQIIFFDYYQEGEQHIDFNKLKNQWITFDFTFKNNIIEGDIQTIKIEKIQKNNIYKM